MLVMTGGDVMSRPDLFQLVAEARATGLPVAVAPSVTRRLTSEPLERLMALGITSISISLDGATPATHESVRGVHGHFRATLEALRLANSLGFKLQVNTAVMRANVDELAQVAAIVREVAAASWEVFFLVKVGRGRDEQELTPQENEDVARLLFEASQYGFAVRTVEGPWCRRVATDRLASAANFGPVPNASIPLGPIYRNQESLLREILGPPPTAPDMTTVGTRDPLAEDPACAFAPA